MSNEGLFMNVGLEANRAHVRFGEFASFSDGSGRLLIGDINIITSTVTHICIVGIIVSRTHPRRTCKQRTLLVISTEELNQGFLSRTLWENTFDFQKLLQSSFTFIANIRSKNRCRDKWGIGANRNLHSMFRRLQFLPLVFYPEGRPSMRISDKSRTATKGRQTLWRNILPFQISVKVLLRLQWAKGEFRYVWSLRTCHSRLRLDLRAEVRVQNWHWNYELTCSCSPRSSDFQCCEISLGERAKKTKKEENQKTKITSFLVCDLRLEVQFLMHPRDSL